MNNEIIKEKCLMVVFGICKYSGGGLKITKNPELIKNLYSIVTISSVASSKGNKGISLYSSSKWVLSNSEMSLGYFAEV